MGISFKDSDLGREIRNFHFPRYNELPVIDLYMDQITSFINETMRILTADGLDDDRSLTKSMVNNYVKQKVVAPPVNKKYSRDHMIYLIVICTLKKVFSLTEIFALTRVQVEYRDSMEAAYDAFCDEFEKALQETIDVAVAPRFNLDEAATLEDELLHQSVQAVVSKVYTDKQLQFYAKDEAKFKAGHAAGDDIIA